MMKIQSSNVLSIYYLSMLYLVTQVFELNTFPESDII